MPRMSKELGPVGKLAVAKVAKEAVEIIRDEDRSMEDILERDRDDRDMDIDEVVRGTRQDDVFNGILDGTDSVAELVLGLGGNDTMFAGPGDILVGGQGRDLLHGHEGDNVVIGGAGDDALIGILGNDTLVGGVGNDVLVTFNGNHELHGGAGADTFIFYVNGTEDPSFNGGDYNTTPLDAVIKHTVHDANLALDRFMLSAPIDSEGNMADMPTVAWIDNTAYIEYITTSEMSSPDKETGTDMTVTVSQKFTTQIEFAGLTADEAQTIEFTNYSDLV